MTSLCVLLALIGQTPGVEAAAQSLRADDLLGHIKVLASDAFEGRGPGTPGEEKTVDYLTAQFKAMGLLPGNPDGTYVQAVPLIGYQAKATSGTIAIKGTTIDLKSADDWVAVARHPQAKVEVKDSEVVFVGYGVEAPEYGWDDYKGVDVRGKTIVMLINDPAVPDPSHPGELDPSMFKGRAMTYYGRWTYKYEIASKKGAAAALIVHEAGPAGYPYEVVVGSWGRENIDIQEAPGKGGPRVLVEGWLALDKAKALLKAGGHDFDALKKAARAKDFRPVDLGGKATLSVENTTREIRSKNVVAKVEGSDPALKDEYVIYTAHWDHLGIDPALKGDQIYNGAADNASGVAAILEIARGFSRLKTKPKRSILFLAVTAEEKGLLGAKYYATHPLYPLNKTLADLNMDVINLWGRTKDLISVGRGNTTLDDILGEAAARKGRTVGPDAEPEKGMFYRSDHFEFAKEGVPALNTKGGMTYLDKPADYAKLKRDEYTQKDYHKVTDEVKPDWDLSGALDDLRLMFEVGYAIADGATYPEWKPGTEFKAVREASLRRGGE